MNKITETKNIFRQQVKNWLHWLLVLMCHVLIFEPILSETHVLFVLFLVNYCSLNRADAAKHRQKQIAILQLLVKITSKLSASPEA